jgi:glycosyltransferase involved in cell wall biosynthesis
MREHGVKTAVRVAFAGGNGYPPEAQGGVQSSTHDLATRLVDAGGRAFVLAPLYGDGLFGLAARARLKFGRSGLVRDDRMGYGVHRAWFPDRVVRSFCDQVRPDVAVVQCHGTVPLAREFRAAGVPVVIYLRNVEFDELGGDLAPFSDAEFIANSPFTARAYRDRFGIEATVIPPTLRPSSFATASSEEVVTFINPVPEKGLDKALAIAARCPDIPFVFLESWLLDPPVIERLQAAIRPYPNIRLERRVPDIRTVYARTRLLLVPSKWAEAWGRVASEAHCSGIPVIGSDRGGLPDSIGPGGLVLDYEAPLDDWVGALRDLWFDDAQRARLGQAARAYALRPEMDGARQFTTFMSVVTRAANAALAA